MLSIEINQTDSTSTHEIQHHTEIVTAASVISSGNHDLISTTGDDLENVHTQGPMITGISIVTTITSSQDQMERAVWKYNCHQ